ncbi:hypothetical protein BKA81DRAFT_371803 [Phyllosticta paracitricarpa]
MRVDALLSKRHALCASPALIRATLTPHSLPFQQIRPPTPLSLLLIQRHRSGPSPLSTSPVHWLNLEPSPLILNLNVSSPFSPPTTESQDRKKPLPKWAYPRIRENPLPHVPLHRSKPPSHFARPNSPIQRHTRHTWPPQQPSLAAAPPSLARPVQPAPHTASRHPHRVPAPLSPRPPRPPPPSPVPPPHHPQPQPQPSRPPPPSARPLTPTPSSRAVSTCTVTAGSGATMGPTRPIATRFTTPMLMGVRFRASRMAVRGLRVRRGGCF